MGCKNCKCDKYVVNLEAEEVPHLPGVEYAPEDYIEKTTEVYRVGSSAKPPRHYFYAPGLKELARTQSRPYHLQEGAVISFIDDLIDALAVNYIQEAKDIIVYVVDELSAQYEGYLISDTSYVVKMGAEKHGHSNYRKGMPFSLCISSFMGHYEKYVFHGEELDEESGYHHLLHCCANMLILLGYLSDDKLVEEFNDLKEL